MEKGHFDQIAVAPSVSVNRVDTNGKPDQELDLLLYRLGLYADYLLPGENVEGGITARASLVYVTDTGHNAGLSGYEVEVEPRLQNNILPVGYPIRILPKQPRLESGADDAWLLGEFRVWLHLEGGDVQHAGEDWLQTEGVFERIGPMAQFQLTAPQVLFGRDFSLTVQGSYLGAAEGPEDHAWFLKATAALTLYNDKERNHKLSLSVVYQRGGISFSKEEVDLLTAGISVLF